MYKYVDLGVFSFRNIDLPRKVRYKKRKENKEPSPAIEGIKTAGLK